MKPQKLRPAGLFFTFATLTLLVIALASCAGQAAQRIIIPTDPVEDKFQPPEDTEVWQIIDSQNGPDTYDFPMWAARFYESGIPGVELLSQFSDRYVFIARNRGENFSALRQWAENFSAQQDLAVLVVNRVERRFVSRALLYPDDAYGGFFMAVIRGVANERYSEAVKEETFWVRRRAVSSNDPSSFVQAGSQHYEYLVLVSIDKTVLQNRILRIMGSVQTAGRTRDQAAATALIMQNFFDGF